MAQRAHCCSLLGTAQRAHFGLHPKSISPAPASRRVGASLRNDVGELRTPRGLVRTCRRVIGVK
eukprot:8796348-Pyramimonas_sp.AAC.1